MPEESKPEVSTPKADAPLTALRAQLSEAEHAAAAVGEDAEDAVKAAAKKAKEDAERALAKAKLEAVAAEKKVAVEVREVETEVEDAVKHSLQELNQSASTQNVRGTDALSPAEHAKRLNPTP